MLNKQFIETLNTTKYEEKKKELNTIRTYLLQQLHEIENDLAELSFQFEIRVGAKGD